MQDSCLYSTHPTLLIFDLKKQKVLHFSPNIGSKQKKKGVRSSDKSEH